MYLAVLGLQNRTSSLPRLSLLFLLVIALVQAVGLALNGLPFLAAERFASLRIRKPDGGAQ